MKNFFIQAWLSYKGLFHWLTWPSYISNVFLRPAIQIILFSILGRFAIGEEKTQILALGLAVQQMSVILMGGVTQSYSNETLFKTLPFYYVSPANRIMNFLSRPLWHFPNALLSFASGITAAWLIIGLNCGTANWPAFLISVLTIALSLTAFAQLAGMYALSTKDWIISLPISGGLLFAFSGVVIPISIFPDYIQEFCKILPITNGLFAVRATFAGAPLADVSGFLLRELLTGIAYYFIATFLFLFIEHWARRTGALNVEV